MSTFSMASAMPFPADDMEPSSVESALQATASSTGSLLSSPTSTPDSSNVLAVPESTPTTISHGHRLTGSEIGYAAVVPILAVVAALGALAIRLMKNHRERKVTKIDKKRRNHWELDAEESGVPKPKLNAAKPKKAAELETVEIAIELEAYDERRARQGTAR